jgi:hypothetical protein
MAEWDKGVCSGCVYTFNKLCKTCQVYDRAVIDNKEVPMVGARQYAELFETGQYGKLYIVSGSHARGKTFHIFVLPEGEQAIPNGSNNPPLNKDAVEVYGVTEGQPGWTEKYGWLHHGKWEDDFAELVKQAIQKKTADEADQKACELRRQRIERDRIERLLAAY